MLRKLLGLFRNSKVKPVAKKDDTPDFPYELIVVPGKDAEQRLMELRIEGDGVFTPVAFADEKQLEYICEALPVNSAQIEQTLQQAADYDLDELFTGVLSEDGKYFANMEIGEPQSKQSHNTFVFPTDLVKETYLDRVYIAKIPTVHAWEIPAYLDYGGWNECPWPAVQVAVHKYWYEMYGAEIVAMTGDTIECIVAHPPETPEQALALAFEQVQYCEDIVAQGAETLQVLASGLRNGKVWFFWWD